MNRLMKSIVLDAVFAGLLIAGLYYGVDGAMNVISGVIVIAFLLSLSLFAESAKAQLKALGQPALPHWFSAVFDMLVVVALWWHGYFMLGGMWAFTAELTITTWRKALKDEPAEGA